MYRVGFSLLVLVGIVGCSPSVNDQVIRDSVYDKPNYRMDDGSMGSYAVNVEFDTSSLSSADSIDMVPIDYRALPYNAKKLRHEGNGWYTFLWKGGCYIGSAQFASANQSYQFRFTMAHNKQVCDLSVDIPEDQPEEYEYSTQY